MNLFFKIIKISILIFIIKIFGFIRDIIIAKIFDSNNETDAFFISLKLSNILRRFFAEGIFTYTFIPILSKYKEKKKKINEFISSTYFILNILLILVVLILITYSNSIISMIFLGFNKKQQKIQLVSKLFKINLTYTLLIYLTSYISSILNTWKYFTPTFLYPIISNITIIFFSIFISKYFQPKIISLSWAIIIGGILQLLFLKIFLKKICVKINYKLINIKNRGAIKIIKNILPTILSGSITQIIQIINISISSSLKKGSISWMYYAEKFTELPVNILSTTINTIMLPSLSIKYQKKDQYGFSKLIDNNLKTSLLLIIPNSLIIIILSKRIIMTFFQHGNFNYYDTIMTYKILSVYSISLAGIIINKILTPCFYTQLNNKTPIKISILVLIKTQIINMFIFKIFKHISLSISSSFISYINIYFLYKKLRKENIYKPKKWNKFLIKIFISNFLMLITILFFKKKIKFNINNNYFIKIIKLIIIYIFSITIYVFSLIIINLTNKKKFKRKFFI